ncbi:MAG: hypothetical protein QXO40_00145 [Candidatus Aenigmatarchaeota archaeon]
MRPIWTFKWWWLVKSEEIQTHFFDFFTGILIFLKWLLDFKIPILFIIISFIAGLLISPQKIKTIPIYIEKHDTIYIAKTDTLKIYRSIYHFDTLYVYISQRDTFYKSKVEKESIPIIIEKKPRRKIFFFEVGLENRVPFKTENTNLYGGCELNICKFKIEGNIKVDKNLNLNNEIRLGIKF